MTRDNEWLAFFKKKYMELFVMFLALAGGGLYGIYVLKKGTLPVEEIGGYLKYRPQEIDWPCFGLAFLSHIKKMGVIWFLGLSKFFSKVAVLILAGYIFCYGFSVTVMIALLDLRSYWMGVVLVLLQGMIVIGYLLSLLGCLLKADHYDKQYWEQWIWIVCIGVILTCMQIIYWIVGIR